MELSKSFMELVKHVSGVKELCEWCHQDKPTVFFGMYGNLCDGCRKPLQEALPPAEAPKKTRVINLIPVDPKKAGVIGWVQDLIFRDEKISVVRLKGLMEEKGYKAATLNAQMGRVKKSYVIKDDFIYLNADCVTKLAEVRK